MVRFCAQCGGSLPRRARFCGSCGAATRAHQRELVDQRRTEARAVHRRGHVIAIVFVGAIAAIVVPFLIVPDSTMLGLFLAFTLDLIVGTVAVLMLGRGAWRQAVGRMPDGISMLKAVGVAAVTLTLAVAYVSFLNALIPDDSGAGWEPDDDERWAFLVAALLFAPVAEEWLCRGSLWAAIRPVTNRNTAIIVTAIVFGMLHGLNGAHFLEVPHRFAMGCVLGWLRATTGSLWPCVAAHGMHNLAAVMLE